MFIWFARNVRPCVIDVPLTNGIEELEIELTEHSREADLKLCSCETDVKMLG